MELGQEEEKGGVLGAKLKRSMDGNEFAALKEMFCKKPHVHDVNVAKGQKHMGWVQPPPHCAMH